MQQQFDESIFVFAAGKVLAVFHPLIAKRMKIRKVKQKMPIIEEEDEIKMPIIEYQTLVTVNEGKVFTGRTTPIPTVLFEYLASNELKVFSIILRQHRDHGCCIVKTTALARAIGITHISIANILTKLKNMGLVHYEVSRKRRNKVIDWGTIEVLDQMSTNWKPGGLVALRRKLKDTNINKIVPDMYRDIRAKYEINNDQMENEEYD